MNKTQYLSYRKRLADLLPIRNQNVRNRKEFLALVILLSRVKGEVVSLAQNVQAPGIDYSEKNGIILDDGNTHLPFGLCKKYGINLPKGSTPEDAWNALKEKGVTPESAYKEAESGESESSDPENGQSENSSERTGKRNYATEYGYFPDRRFTKRGTPFSKPTLRIPRKEFGKVCHEISTNFRLYENKRYAIHSTTDDEGAHIYFFENAGFDDYNIYGKEDIE